tara:strand:+ start:832 stop:1731 length:900 start_codon:yes stop_codon:yes gene_type:complete
MTSSAIRKPPPLNLSVGINNSNNNNSNSKIKGRGKVLTEQITRRPYFIGPRLGSGRQGVVYEHQINNKKVVKLRKPFKSNGSSNGFSSGLTYIQNDKTSIDLKNYYIKEIKKAFGISQGNLTINNNTSRLINKYPLFFLEAFIQHKLGEAGISAKVHEIFATEEREKNSMTTLVHIYIVMDKLYPVESNATNRIGLANRAFAHQVLSQNGNSWGATPKDNHVMANQNGTLKLINFGNSRYLSIPEMIYYSRKRHGTNIIVTGHHSATIHPGGGAGSKSPRTKKPIFERSDSNMSKTLLA